MKLGYRTLKDYLLKRSYRISNYILQAYGILKLKCHKLLYQSHDLFPFLKLKSLFNFLLTNFPHKASLELLSGYFYLNSFQKFMIRVIYMGLIYLAVYHSVLCQLTCNFCLLLKIHMDKHAYKVHTQMISNWMISHSLLHYAFRFFLIFDLANALNIRNGCILLIHHIHMNWEEGSQMTILHSNIFYIVHHYECHFYGHLLQIPDDYYEYHKSNNHFLGQYFRDLSGDGSQWFYFIHSSFNLMDYGHALPYILLFQASLHLQFIQYSPIKINNVKIKIKFQRLLTWLLLVDLMFRTT